MKTVAKAKTKPYAFLELKQNAVKSLGNKEAMAEKYYSKILKTIKDNNMQKRTVIFAIAGTEVKDKDGNGTGIYYEDYLRSFKSSKAYKNCGFKLKFAVNGPNTAHYKNEGWKRFNDLFGKYCYLRDNPRKEIKGLSTTCGW